MKKRISTLLIALCLIFENCGCNKQTVNSEIEQLTSREMQLKKIAEEYHWDLTPIYADIDAIQEDLQKVKNDLIPAISEFQGKLNTENNILAFMNQTEIINQKLLKLNNYATFLTEQNQMDNAATSLLQQVNKMKYQYSETVAFCSPELLTNSNEFLDKLLENPEMKPYSTRIKRMRSNAEHVLPKETEALLLPLSNIANGASILYSKLTSADMKFPTIKDPDGNDIEIDKSNWVKIVTSNPNREFRKKSSEIFMSEYGQYRNTLAQNMDNFIQATVSLAHIHNYATAKEAALASSTVPTEVYDNLIAAANNNLDTTYRYIALRKKILGADKFYSSDMLYPLVDELNVSFSYEESKNLIIDALEPLGEEYQNILRKAFNERWIDVYPSDGKSGGAFSGGLYGVHPYILTNFTDDYYSISTLAHELGHTVHQYESEQNQKSTLTSAPTSFTSEVASTTNELLLSDYMIKNAKSDDEKLYYLFSELTTLDGTFFSQAQFSEFEDAMYQIVEDGGSLNADMLEDLWIKINNKYSGSDVISIDGSQYAWSRIPHFYYNYYVFQYATSISAACTISQRIENGEDGAVEQYLEFLKTGDSDDGAALLGIAGVDITSPSLADDLIARYNSLIDQIEELKHIA